MHVLQLDTLAKEQQQMLVLRGFGRTVRDRMSLDRKRSGRGESGCRQNFSGSAEFVLAPALLGLALGLLASISLAASAVNAYGTKVSFAKGRPLKFPDFTLEYVGERRVTSKRYPRGFLNHDFTASAGPERVTVSWSAGTGDIGPAIFTIAGKQFGLELVESDSRGRLKPNELVITIKRRAT